MSHVEHLAALGQLAAGVAHNYNNLLAGVLLCCEEVRLWAERAGAPPEVMRALRLAVDAAERGGEISRRLLEFARQSPVSLQPVDVAVPVGRALELVRLRPESKFVGFDVRLAGCPRVVADAGGLEEIALNLFVNAVQAMGGSGRVSVWWEGQGPWVFIRFANTGTRIPAELLSRIFEPFFSTKGGTGLGLSSSLGLARQMGGDLWAEDVLVGAEFVLKLRREEG